MPVDGSSPYDYATTVTVVGNTGTLAKDDNTWTGWNTEAGGGGTGYVATDEFPMPAANTVLYAVWLADAAATGGGSIALRYFPVLFGIIFRLWWAELAVLIVAIIIARAVQKSRTGRAIREDRVLQEGRYLDLVDHVIEQDNETRTDRRE